MRFIFSRYTYACEQLCVTRASLRLFVVVSPVNGAPGMNPHACSRMCTRINGLMSLAAPFVDRQTSPAPLKPPFSNHKHDPPWGDTRGQVQPSVCFLFIASDDSSPFTAMQVSNRNLNTVRQSEISVMFRVDWSLTVVYSDVYRCPKK